MTVEISGHFLRDAEKLETGAQLKALIDRITSFGDICPMNMFPLITHPGNLPHITILQTGTIFQSKKITFFIKFTNF